jgi:phage tail-like protein
MPNRRPDDAIGSFNFRVEIEGVTQGPFIAVEFLQSVTKVIESKNGNNPIVHKTPGRHTYGNIVLRRVWVNDDALWNWRKAVTDGRIERKAGSIVILNALSGGQGDSEIGRFNFFEAWPCGWRLGPWDGNSDSTLVEEVEIAVEKVERG